MKLTEKRAKLYREWLLATIANDEEYYYSTLMTGIPDGDDMETVMDDLTNGEYDEDIDNMLATYDRAKRLYGKSGYYVAEKVIYDENEAIRAAKWNVPGVIYKGEKPGVLRYDDQYIVNVLRKDGYTNAAQRLEELMRENEELKRKI